MGELTINVSDHGNIKLIKCGGIVDTDTYPALKKELDRLIDAGFNKLILNLSRVSFMSSAGWGAILANIEKARSAGGCIKLSGLSDKLQLTYEMLELSNLVQAFEDDEKALADFQPGA